MYILVNIKTIRNGTGNAACIYSISMYPPCTCMYTNVPVEIIRFWSIMHSTSPEIQVLGFRQTHMAPMSPPPWPGKVVHHSESKSKHWEKCKQI